MARIQMKSVEKMMLMWMKLMGQKQMLSVHQSSAETTAEDFQHQRCCCPKTQIEIINENY